MKRRLGILGGSGVYAARRAGRRALGEGRVRLRDALRRDPARRAGRRADGLPAAPRPRTSDSAVGGQLPRQPRRAETRRCDGPDLALRVRLASRGSRAGQLPAGRSVRRPHLARGPRASSARGLVAHVSLARPVCAPLLDRLEQSARELGLPLVRGGTYLAIEGPQFSTSGRVAPVSLVGLRRDRHDQHAGGQARPRSRAVLRERRDGDGFRLLAPGPRPRRGRADPRGARQQRRARSRAGGPRRAARRGAGGSPARRAATARSTTR